MRSERKKFLIIEILSEIIEKYIEKDIVFTILNLSLPQKGGVMKVVLSVFPDEKADEAIKELNKNQIKIKNELKNKIYLRYLPKKIVFKYSKQLKEAQILDKILKDISKESD